MCTNKVALKPQDTLLAPSNVHMYQSFYTACDMSLYTSTFSWWLQRIQRILTDDWESVLNHFNGRPNEFCAFLMLHFTLVITKKISVIDKWAFENEWAFDSTFLFLSNELSYGNLPAKGQLISKANFEVFIWTLKWTRLFLYFCPSL